jgi:Activator of Hsp90 ATPase homolog 1-like protein
MSNILHRLTIDAAPPHVQDLVAVSFGDRTSATFEILERTPERIVWRCFGGPHDWIQTRIIFAFEPRADGGTTLRFTHEGWQQETDVMCGCSTNWGAYLVSLKSGAEGNGFSAFPGGEISRWS